ncbi:hypothetical protein LOAG_14101 [Loa loa]|nr:hypothetical protein LOAG_14101 [Loa loa]EFO14417.2 hypothetical protein LOAG_14101 [Loa loa]
MRRGFRLKTGINEQQRAELSWLAANTEPNRQPSPIPPYVRSFRLTRITTKQPQISSIKYINNNNNNNNNNYHQHRYYDKSLIHSTFSPIYYASKFRTIPPTYNNYLSPTFTQPTYLPLSTMMTAVRNILAILQKTMYPNDNNDIDFNTTRIIPKDENFTISNLQSSKSLSSLLLSSSLSPLLSLTSSSSSSTTAATGTGKVDEIRVTGISENDGDVETGQLVNVEQAKGAGIQKVKETMKSVESIFDKISKSGNNTTITIIPATISTTTTTIATTTTTTTTTTMTTTTSSIDDGSNLLGSLLSGRLDKVDWFGSLFGTKLPTKEEGSAMAQIFEGGIFGPAS